MNTPAMAKRLTAKVPTTTGTLTDKGGRTVPVKFTLTQWRHYFGQFPTFRSADGEIEFLNLADAFDLRDIDEGVTLQGGGIQAEISLLSLRTFSVVSGSLNQGPMLRPASAAQPSVMIHSL